MADPYPYYPSMSQRDVDLSGLGPDAGDEYTGDSMEDFYDYLLTPRNQRERSQHGAMTHYGPSRFASVNPEDAAMAQMVMQLMEGEDVREFNQTNRESDMARRAAADEMMMPQGRGGGSVSYGGLEGDPRMTGPQLPGEEHPMQTQQIGGGMPPGPPPAQGPVSDRDRMLAAAGGVGGADESRVAAAAAQGEGYPQGGGGPSMADRRDIGRLQEELGILGLDIERQASASPEMAGMDARGIATVFLTTPDKVPRELVEPIKIWLLKQSRISGTYGGGGGGGQGAPGPGGSGRFDPATGTIVR
jgi:hypothetical protein